MHFLFIIPMLHAQTQSKTIFLRLQSFWFIANAEQPTWITIFCFSSPLAICCRNYFICFAAFSCYFSIRYRITIYYMYSCAWIEFYGKSSEMGAWCNKMLTAFLNVRIWYYDGKIINEIPKSVFRCTANVSSKIELKGLDGNGGYTQQDNFSKIQMIRMIFILWATAKNSWRNS